MNLVHGVLVCYLVALPVLRWGFGKIQNRVSHSHPLRILTLSEYVYVYEKKSVLKVLSARSPSDPGVTQTVTVWGSPHQANLGTWLGSYTDTGVSCFSGQHFALCFDIVPSQYTEYFPV